MCRTCVDLGPWRWFDDSMLDCCEPLEKIKSEGITFGKVACLAHCNGAKVDAFRTNGSSIEEFRKFVILCAASENCHLITSYHRGHFKQSSRHESWNSVAMYLTEDVPLLLKLEDLKDIQHVLSVIFISPPADLREFIKWIAEIRILEDGNLILSEEEEERLTVKICFRIDLFFTFLIKWQSLIPLIGGAIGESSMDEEEKKE
ncbi:hypothetical protein G4B88_000142, partial [Cannabis sativa]